MPIYEYRCQSCGYEMEKLQKLSDAPLTECPECDKAELKKLISAAAFRLKGAGWYETDFKKDNKRNLVDGDKSSQPPKSSDKTEKSGQSDSNKPSVKSPDKSPKKTTSGNTNAAA